MMYVTLISVCTGSLKNVQCDFFSIWPYLIRCVINLPETILFVINNKNEIKPLNKNNLVDFNGFNVLKNIYHCGLKSTETSVKTLLRSGVLCILITLSTVLGLCIFDVLIIVVNKSFI